MAQLCVADKSICPVQRWQLHVSAPTRPRAPPFFRIFFAVHKLDRGTKSVEQPAGRYDAWPGPDFRYAIEYLHVSSFNILRAGFCDASLQHHMRRRDEWTVIFGMSTVLEFARADMSDRSRARIHTCVCSWFKNHCACNPSGMSVPQSMCRRI